MALYFKDITTLEQARIKAEEAQPVWGMIQIDNIEELTKGLSDRDYTNLWADINNIVVAEIDGFDGFIRNFQDDMYTFAISRGGALVKMESDGFKILEKIRKLPSPRQIPATISIGISENVGTAKEVSERARAALDIALGRGGDQVCIMDGESTRFFGGNTAGVEKNTRVRARVVGQAIHELMNDSEKILVMGHQREDYDALGGAIGIVAIARASVKRCAWRFQMNSVPLKKWCMSSMKMNSGKSILSPLKLQETVEPNTLVIVCDTHRTEMVAVPEALDISERRIVIDHHRRAADFIENPLLTYLEPAASSTSELVTELVQYVGGTFVKLSKAEATGIYAGIVLDTKNFYQQTGGARTFEAAAFLRRAGADIEMVKQLFIETFDSIQLRAKIVLEASCTEGIAISVAPEGMMDMMALAAQSADMLISNEDIEAAFVLYSLNDGGIGVSARSKGKVNVQVVMEALGGGGHRTVAGAQLQGMTIEETKKTILDKALEALHSAEAEEEEE